VFNKVRPGGFILVDNALWDGRVLDPDDRESKAIAAFNDLIQEDQRVENVLLTIRDGVMLIRKKKNI
jgi:predicted O-methyltransferase YrrM